jgi:MYXO-CTERM domain-containing protein
MKAALLLVAGLAAGATGQVFYGGGAGGSIPDNGASSGNVFSSTINIADNLSIQDVNVNLSGLAHTWVGDLLITLSHNGTTVAMSDRPGVPATGAGFSWNLNGNYNFDDEAANGTWESVGTQASTFNLPGGDYKSEQALSAFDGMSTAGAWTLTISDGAGADLGSLVSWGMTITAVPAPGAFAVLGLGGLVAARRRR